MTPESAPLVVVVVLVLDSSPSRTRTKDEEDCCSPSSADLLSLPQIPDMETADLPCVASERSRVPAVANPKPFRPPILNGAP